MKKHDWLKALIKTNIKSALADKSNFIIMSLFMTANNLVWFVIWWIFFAVAGDINGWSLEDVARLFGITAFAYGIGFVFFGGATHMAQIIADGYLDIHLGRPRPALLSLMFSRSQPEGVGDALSGIILIFTLGNATFLQGIGALGLSLLVAVIVVSVAVAINSLIFWTGGKTSISDLLFDNFINLSTMPQHGLPVVFKIILFTVVPAGFVAFLPAALLRSFSWTGFLAMIAAAILAPIIANWIFERGLRRYTSGNRMLEVR